MTLKNWLTFPYLALISLSFIWSNITFSLLIPFIWDAVLCTSACELSMSVGTLISLTFCIEFSLTSWLAPLWTSLQRWKPHWIIYFLFTHTDGRLSQLLSVESTLGILGFSTALKFDESWCCFTSSLYVSFTVRIFLYDWMFPIRLWLIFKSL